MASTQGNQFWKLRQKHGRDKMFDTPELLMESAECYFNWCDQNPYVTTETTTTEKGFIVKEKEILRAYSRKEMFLYLKVSESWLREFKKTASKDFLLVIADIEDFIDSQQLGGATVGLFNANLVARMQGIKDRTDVTTNDKDINEIPLTALQVKELSDKLKNDY